VKPDIKIRTSELSSPAIEQVRNALSEHFSGASVQIDGPISVRDNSEIFHGRIDTAEPLEAAIKRCLVPHTNDPDEAAAKEQFTALQRVSGALADRNERYRVPTPLYLVPALATLAMTWVEGKSLSKNMRCAAVFSKGAGWFENTGAWLGAFHKAGRSRRQVVNLNERLAVIDDLCVPPLLDEAYARATVVQRKAASTLENVETEISWLHGDCKTDNFILSGTNIYGIDISLNHESPVEYDLAQFLNNLDLLLSSPKYLHLRGMRSTLEKAFMRGYQTTGPTVSYAYLNWLRLNFSIAFWHTMLTGQRPGIRTWMLNRMFAKLAARLSAKLI
jgi:tRNA A-37 threonylcarbamoyl transferase component Bud32